MQEWRRPRTCHAPLDFHAAGRRFLQIPGSSPVPDRILRAMSLPTIDHRGPEFGALGLKEHFAKPAVPQAIPRAA